MNLFDEFFAIVREFRKAGIPYAVVGGIAMALHDEPRFTRDIDLLVLPGDMDEVERTLQSLGYFKSIRPCTFQSGNLTLHRFMKAEGEDCLTVDVLAGADEKHRTIIANSVEEVSDAGPVMIARKEDIIWMKRQRGSEQDETDIRRLENDAH